MSDFFLPAASKINSNKRKRTAGTPPTPPTPATPASTSSFTYRSTSTPQSPPTPLSSPSTPPSPPGNGNQTPATPATPETPPSSTSPSCYNSSDSRSATKKQKQKQKQKCISHSSHSHKSPLPPPRKQQQQLYLDFGQASFGSRSICSICNTLIVHGLKEDESQHEQICKAYKLGVSFYSTKARIVGLGNGIGNVIAPSKVQGHSQAQAQAQAGFIVEIRPGDPISWRKKVTRVKEIVDEELGFVTSSSAGMERFGTGTGTGTNGIASKSRSDECYTYCWGDNHNNSSSNSSSNTHQNMIVFLYIVEKRVVGFCSAEVISKGYRLLDTHSNTHTNTNSSTHSSTKQYDPNTEYPAESATVTGPTTRSTQPTKAILGVHQLWCHHLHRQKGIASHLVDAARSKLVFGMTVPYHLVAFSSPTADGALFAKRYSFPDPPLVYEYEL